MVERHVSIFRCVEIDKDAVSGRLMLLGMNDGETGMLTSSVRMVLFFANNVFLCFSLAKNRSLICFSQNVHHIAVPLSSEGIKNSGKLKF